MRTTREDAKRLIMDGIRCLSTDRWLFSPLSFGERSKTLRDLMLLQCSYAGIPICNLQLSIINLQFAICNTQTVETFEVNRCKLQIAN